MPVRCFRSFRFDTRQLRLSKGGRPCALRPKAAALLRLLLLHSDRIVTKREIAQAVWDRPFVSDATIFQTMSELRKMFAPLAPITTYPNQGYQWVAPLRATTSTARRSIAAGLALLVLGGALALHTTGDNPGRTTASDGVTASMTPALSAFTTALGHLRAKDRDQAAHFFRLAVQENPRFFEARLLLSETRLAQGQVALARTHARALIDEAADRDAYAAVAAMALLSRIDAQAGHDESALQWIMAAADQARAEGFACAVLALEAQRDALMMSPLHEAGAAADDGSAALPQLASQSIRSAAPTPDTAHCAQIEIRPPGARNDGQDRAPRAASCQPTVRKTRDFVMA